MMFKEFIIIFIIIILFKYSYPIIIKPVNKFAPSINNSNVRSIFLGDLNSVKFEDNLKKETEERYEYLLIAKLFMKNFNLNKIIVCTDSKRVAELVPRIFAFSLILWSISDCRAALNSLNFYSADWPRSECEDGGDLRACSSARLVILLLCLEEDQNRILDRAFQDNYVFSWIWLIKSFEGRIFSRNLYISLNSMLIQLIKRYTSKEEDKEFYSLEEVWRPGPYLPQQLNYFGFILQEKGFIIEPYQKRPDLPTEIMKNISLSKSDFSCSVYSGVNIDFVRLGERYKLLDQSICLNNLPLYARRKSLRGVHFNITTINDTRSHLIYYDEEKEKDVLTGYFGDVWEFLRQEMNFEYTIHIPKDGEFGGKGDNGSWTGLVGELINGEADAVVALLSRTIARSQVVDYTTTLLQFNYKIFAQKPKSNMLLWEAYTRSFTLDLWGATLATFLLFSMTLILIEHVYSSPKMHRRKKDRSDDAPFLISWAAFTMQGWPTFPDGFLRRLVVWELYLFGTLLSAGYSATLVSFLAVIDDSLGFESLHELLEKSDYRLGIQRGSVLEEIFQTGPFVKAWNKLIIPYKDTLADTYQELQASSFKSSKFAYVGSYEVQMIDIQPRCVIKAAKETLFHNDGSIGLSKRSPYLGLFNHYIRKLKEGGVLRKLKQKYFPEPLKCSSESYQAMTLNQTFSAFLFLAIGMLISFVVFFMEYNKGKSRKPLKNETFLKSITLKG